MSDAANIVRPLGAKEAFMGFKVGESFVIKEWNDEEGYHCIEKPLSVEFREIRTLAREDVYGAPQVWEDVETEGHRFFVDGIEVTYAEGKADWEDWDRSVASAIENA